MRFVCAMCGATVEIHLSPSDGADISIIEAWCCTAHGRPVRMDEVIEGSGHPDEVYARRWMRSQKSSST